MLETYETDIDGMRVSCTDLPAFKALDVAGEIMELMGDVVVTAATNGTLGGPAFIAAFGSKLRHGKGLLSRLLAATVVIRDGKKYELTHEREIDKAFRGDLGGLFKVATWVVETCYRPTFADLSNMASGLFDTIGEAGSPSESADG